MGPEDIVQIKGPQKWIFNSDGPREENEKNPGSAERKVPGEDGR
jgi:hypothetical protein